MRLAWAHARAESLQLIRLPAYSLPTLTFPVILLLLLGPQVGQGEPERLLAGFAAMAVLGVTFFQFGVGIATTRVVPWESYVRTLPVGAGARLAGRVLSALGFALATIVAVSIVAVTVYGAAMATWRALAVLCALLVGGIPFALLGIALGYLSPPRAAVPIANFLFLPLAIGGALWGRPSGLPHQADVVSQLLPTRNWVEILDSLATGDSRVPPRHVAALAAWAVLFAAVAAWGYRRDEGERFS